MFVENTIVITILYICFVWVLNPRTLNILGTQYLWASACSPAHVFSHFCFCPLCELPLYYFSIENTEVGVVGIRPTCVLHPSFIVWLWVFCLSASLASSFLKMVLRRKACPLFSSVWAILSIRTQPEPHWFHKAQPLCVFSGSFSALWGEKVNKTSLNASFHLKNSFIPCISYLVFFVSHTEGWKKAYNQSSYSFSFPSHLPLVHTLLLAPFIMQSVHLWPRLPLPWLLQIAWLIPAGLRKANCFHIIFFKD